MKSIKYIFFLLSTLLMLACEKKEEIKLDLGQAIPSVLSSSLNDDYVLDNSVPHDSIMNFKWTEATSEVDVAIVYQLEVGIGDAYTSLTPDTVGFERKIAVEELNIALGKVNADTSKTNAVKFRVLAKIANQSGGGTSATLSSNELGTNVLPYPSNYKLFLVKGPEYLVEDNSIFMISSNADHKYSGTFQLDENIDYKFVNTDIEGATRTLYGVDDASNPTKLVSGGSIAFNVSEEGKYSVSANINSGAEEFKYAKAQPLLWIPGAHNGWSHDIKEPTEGDPESYTNVNLSSENNDGVYTGKVWLTGEFKFTNQASWNGTNYGSVDGTLFALDTDPGAGNHHVDNYNGIGLYTLEVNANSLTFKITDFQGPPIELPKGNALFVVGDHNGWKLNVRDSLVETIADSKIYEGILNIADAFRLQKAAIDSTDGVEKLVATNTYGSPEITETTDPNNPVLDGLVEENGTYTIRVPNSGLYKLVVNLSAGEYTLGQYIASVISAPADGTDIVLTDASSPATTFTWSAAEFGNSPATSYTLKLTSPAGSADLATGLTSTTVDIDAATLNSAILSLDGSVPGTAYGAKVEVIATSGNINDPELKSESISITVTPFAAYPSELWMTGGALGGWDWNTSYDVQLQPVASHPEKFWAIAYLTAGQSGIKFSPVRDWGSNFGGAGSDTSVPRVTGFGGDNVDIATTGYYTIVVDYSKSEILIVEPTVYLIGDAVGSWDSNNPDNLFTVDNAKEKITITKTLSAANIRMYVAAEFNSQSWLGGGDWWQSEFNVIGGNIEYRGNGGDQAPVPVNAGSAVIDLNFKTNTGSITQ